MADPYLEDELPLTSMVGGSVRLSKLIEELEEMFPDVYPDHTIEERELAFRAGAISIIRLLKSKLK